MPVLDVDLRAVCTRSNLAVALGVPVVAVDAVSLWQHRHVGSRGDPCVRRERRQRRREFADLRQD